MTARSIPVFLLFTGLCFGLEFGVALGSALPVGGFESASRAGLSGTVYGSVGDRFSVTVQAEYGSLAGKHPRYGLTLTSLACDLGYRLLNRPGSTLAVVAGAGPVFIERRSGNHAERGVSFGMRCGLRVSQYSGPLRSRLELLPVVVTDGKGWGSILGFRFGIGYAR